jgi:hypothetical protein
MPDFIIPDEADHCPHCNKVLRNPPNCCAAAIDTYDEDEQKRWAELAKRTREWYDTEEVY